LLSGFILKTLDMITQKNAFEIRVKIWKKNLERNNWLPQNSKLDGTIGIVWALEKNFRRTI